MPPPLSTLTSKRTYADGRVSVCGAIIHPAQAESPPFKLSILRAFPPLSETIVYTGALPAQVCVSIPAGTPAPTLACSKLSQKNAPLLHSLEPFPLEELLLELDEEEDELEDEELLEDDEELEDELELLELEEELLLELDELLELEELGPPPQAANAKADSRNKDRRIVIPE